ncbi:MAG: KH domain-containing protein [Bacillales bacterium]|nr:KH domain-containing protein [Bacillales bacterium]MDY6002910.1 KH domain-containing protein [Bacilli bacterium]
MDYSNIIHTICDPFLHNPDSLIVREAPTSDEKSVTLLIYAEAEDTARLIGKKGAVANALRELISVAGKSENKRIFLKFESYGEEKE